MKINAINVEGVAFVQLEGESDNDREEIQKLINSHHSLPDGSLIFPRKDQVDFVKIRVQKANPCC